MTRRKRKELKSSKIFVTSFFIIICQWCNLNYSKYLQNKLPTDMSIQHCVYFFWLLKKICESTQMPVKHIPTNVSFSKQFIYFAIFFIFVEKTEGRLFGYDICLLMVITHCLPIGGGEVAVHYKTKLVP
jgi:hypothetical protein